MTDVRYNPTVDGVRRGNRLLAWLCAKCGFGVREPNSNSGRAWCGHCEDYVYTEEVSR